MSTPPWGDGDNNRNAFVSPTTAAKVRLGQRGKSPAPTESGSVSTRRSTTMIQSPEDAEIFEQLSGSTAVSISNSERRRKKRGGAVVESLDLGGNIISKLSDGAMNLMQSFSPASGAGESMEDDDEDLPSDLDLGQNDNSFHVLASLLVEFFQNRYTASTIVLLPEDRFAIDRLLPKTAVLPFIDAVNYRLGFTPSVPTTPIQFLTLECQKLCLDLEDPNRNPILVASRLLKDTPITLQVMSVANDGTLKQDDHSDSHSYVMDVQHHHSSSSSSRSGVRVASSEDIAEEMNREATGGHAVFDRVGVQGDNAEQPIDLSDGDSLPTEHDIDDPESPVVQQHPAHEDAQSKEPLGKCSSSDSSRSAEVSQQAAHPSLNHPKGTYTPSAQTDHEKLGSGDKETLVKEPAPKTGEERRGSAGKEIAVSVVSEPPRDIGTAKLAKQAKAVAVNLGTKTTNPQRHSTSSGAPTLVSQIQSSAGSFFADLSRSVMDSMTVKSPENNSSVPDQREANAQGASTLHSSVYATKPTDPSVTTNQAVADSKTVDPSVSTSLAVATIERPERVPKKPIDETKVNNTQARPLNPLFPNFASYMDKNAAPLPKRNDNSVVVPTKLRSYSPPITSKSVVKITPGPKPENPFAPPHPKIHKLPNKIPDEKPEAKPEAAGFEMASLTPKLSNRSDQTDREQLLDELKEAEEMLGMSITPETTGFWQNHRDSIAARLASMREDVPAKDTEQAAPSSYVRDDKISSVPSSGSAPFVGDSMRALPGTIHAANEPTGSKTFSEVTPTHEVGGGQGNRSPNLMTSATGSMTQKEALPMVDVVAPADLPGGYQFEAEIEGKRFLAIVPPGGVQQGETFTCYMRELDSVAVDIPVGYWKDGLYDLFTLGPYHPVLWHSIFCPLLALGQIQTRIDLDFLGRPRFGASTVSNRSMMLTLVVFWALTNIGLFVACNVKWSHGMELTMADICAFLLTNGTMFAYIVFVTQSTRNSLREKFLIREERCFDLEDLCLSLACLPCTVGQMARHTANYDNYDAVCCSDTGLPEGVCVNKDVLSTSPYNQDGYVV